MGGEGHSFELPPLRRVRGHALLIDLDVAAEFSRIIMQVKQTTLQVGSSLSILWSNHHHMEIPLSVSLTLTLKNTSKEFQFMTLKLWRRAISYT